MVETEQILGKIEEGCQIVNPFLNFIKVENYSDIFSEFNSLYIMCTTDSNIINNNDIYQYYIDKTHCLCIKYTLSVVLICVKNLSKPLDRRLVI